MTESEIRCPRCGRPVPSGYAGGNCAACLFDSVLGDEPLTLPPEDGEVLMELGDYEILGEIGRGGTGVVYRARQRSLQRIVALKTLHGGAVNSRDAYERLKVEANAVARLDHPRIVSLYEVGRHSGTHYLALRLFEHGSLADALKTRRFSATEAARLIASAAEAVHHAHSRGVLHRDLKPSNLLLDEQGVPHVADFGLAKLADSDTSLTLSTSVLGTPAYMAPEQASGHAKEAGTPADVYSLGAILFELLTGRPPFEGRSALEVLRLVADTEPPSPRALNPQVDRDLEAICLKCLEKDPGRRYASAAALAEDLARWGRHETVSIRPATPSERAVKWVRRRPLLAGATVAVLLTFAAGVVATAVQWRRAEREREGAARRAYQATITLAERRIGEGDIEAAKTLLFGQPERFRGWEWGRLVAQCHSDLLSIPVLENPGVPVGRTNFQVVVSEDGRWALAGGDGLADVVDVRAQSVVRRLGTNGVPVGLGEFSPDGRFLALAGPGPGFTVWEIDGWKERLRLDPEERQPLSIRFHPDGSRLVTAAAGGRVRVWDLQDGRRRFEAESTPAWVEDIRFSPDGRRLVPVHHGDTTKTQFAVWDSETGRVLAVLPKGPLGYRRYTLDPGGIRYATVTWDGKAEVWEVGKDEPLFGTLPEGGGVAVALLSPDGSRMATVRQENGQWKFWDLRTGFSLPVSGERGLSTQTHGNPAILATLLGDRMVKVWDWETGRPGSRFPTGRIGLKGVPYATANGRFLTALVWNGFAAPSLHLWGLPGPDRRMQPTFPAFKGGMSPDGKTVALGHFASQVSLYDADTGRRSGHLDDHHLWATSVAWTGDGRTLFTSSADHTIRRWAMPEGRLEAVFRQLDSPIWSVSSSRDGRVVASSDLSSRIGIWDGRSGVLLDTVSAGAGNAGPVDMDPEGRWVAGAVGPERVWSVVERKPIPLRPMDAGAPGRIGALMSVRFSPDGRRLATMEPEGVLRLWDTATWGQVARHRARRGALSMAFSPDGRRLFVGSSDTSLAWLGFTGVDVHDAETGELLLAFADASGCAPSIDVSRDGRRLFRVVVDNGVQIHGAEVWDAFPWKDSDYPGGVGEPLASRVRRFALDQERSRLRRFWEAPPEAAERLLPEPRSHWAPRSPETPPGCVDLTPAYNGHLETGWYPFDTFDAYEANLAEFPRGVVRLAGIDWDVRGVVTTGADSFAFSHFRSGRTVRDIPVGRRCRRLHFLHSSFHTQSEERSSGRYRLHYADGTEAVLELVSGEDIADISTRNGFHEVSKGEVAWEGSDATSRKMGVRLRVYHRAFENPHPEKEIVSMDLQAEGGGVKPFLIALTVE